jgi:hypothetical protein
MMDFSERGNGIVNTQYVGWNNFGIPATCFAQSGPDLEGKCTIQIGNCLSFALKTFVFS